MDIPDFKPPYPNSSHIEFGARNQRDVKHYQTTYRNDLIFEHKNLKSNNPAIQAFKNKWLRSRLQKWSFGWHSIILFMMQVVLKQAFNIFIEWNLSISPRSRLNTWAIGFKTRKKTRRPPKYAQTSMRKLTCCECPSMTEKRRPSAAAPTKWFPQKSPIRQSQNAKKEILKSSRSSTQKNCWKLKSIIGTGAVFPETPATTAMAKPKTLHQIETYKINRKIANWWTSSTQKSKYTNRLHAFTKSAMQI